MVKVLKKVGCLRLHTAGVVVGWLGVVGAFLSIIIAACLIGYADDFVTFMFRYLGAEPDPDTHSFFKKMIVMYSCIYLGAAIVSGVASGFLVYGTMKNRHLMILPWLVIHAIGIFANFLSLLGAAYAMFGGPIEKTLNFFLAIASFSLYLYLYIGIYSLYKYIQSNGDVAPRMHRPVPSSVPQHNTIYSKI
ncbi:hypothetical protein KR093_007958 [Drosophila rubida]|uniref:Uncharacterized protein n=1 Tax=Drosophila rubida TaxID=30044 RepID=A0AAD4K0W7_9MUSC|nr:hypothetical protein KR093_007958 [Drosophila rubida]